MSYPFIDGNKGTACAAMETFIELNGYKINLSDEEEYNMVMQVAQGNMIKQELSQFIEQYVQSK